MRIRLLSMALLTALSVMGGCATGGSVALKEGDSLLLSSGVRNARFSGQSIIYNRTPAPVIIERKFVSAVEISVRGNIRSYRFKNHFAKDTNLADTEVVVAISGNTGGFGVYDSKGSRLAEYAKGIVSGNALMFENKTSQGSLVIKWYFGDTVIGSVIESFDTKGNLMSSEMTTYRAVRE